MPNALNAMPEKREQEQMVLVNFVPKVSTVQAKKMTALPLQTQPNVLFVQPGITLIQGVRNANFAVLVRIVTSMEKIVKNVR